MGVRKQPNRHYKKGYDMRIDRNSGKQQWEWFVVTFCQNADCLELIQWHQVATTWHKRWAPETLTVSLPDFRLLVAARIRMTETTFAATRN